MSKVNERSNTSETYYFPHHSVLKESSTTTKIRVVFDGSSKSGTNVSLNQIQMVGPVVQNSVYTILVNFRLHTNVLCGDIEKMYRQILIHEDDRVYQRILWRDQPDDTVTYGTSSAPYLATRCLKQLAIDIRSQHPEASQVIQDDIYVDDLITGSDFLDHLKQIKQEITSILESSGFNMRKWTSNNDELVRDLQAEHTLLAIDSESRPLGLVWNHKTDSLQCSAIHLHERPERSTKRTILSTVAQIFDPLGIPNPVVVQGKLILQELWRQGILWDEAIPVDSLTRWLELRSQLHIINNITVPRHALCSYAEEIELHGFSDASEKAYGACVYLRSRDDRGNYHSHLLTSKSRLAPIKQVTLPWLELCAAVLLAQLMHRLKPMVKTSKYFYWTDSKIVLSWINSCPSKWHTYVANRVADIQSHSTIDCWGHVRSEDNPADVVSRGRTPMQLRDCAIWWTGPCWLKQEDNKWPTGSRDKDSRTLDLELEVPEGRVVAVHAATQKWRLVDTYSSLSKLLHVVAYCRRFCHNAKATRDKRLNGELSESEINSTLICLVRVSQSECFHEELTLLKNRKPLQNTSSLLPLSPFMDEEAVLRVGGRLDKSNIPFESKHQALLHPNHTLTKLIARHEHVEQAHCGPQALLKKC